MKASQKGMKLNEVRYFRQPRPYTRKRIAKMRLLPDLPVLHRNEISNNEHRRSISSSERSRDHCVNLDQRSREIACWIPSDFEKDPNKGRDTFSETDPEIFTSLSESDDLMPEQGGIQPEVEPELKGKEGTREVSGKVESNLVENKMENFEEKSKIEIPTIVKIPKVTEKKIGRDDRRERLSNSGKNSESEKTFWSRYESIRKILDFFGHLLGRTVNNGVPRSGEARQRVGTSEKTSIKRQKERSSKRKSPKDDRVFIADSTKRMIDTRDERLRATTLLEREIRKLEEENRRYKRILESKFKTRQMSSPLH